MRYALRSLLRTPGFALAAVLTLGLGIGANTAIFSAVDAALLRPLPFPHPDQLVQIWETHPAIPHLSAAYPDYIDWQKSASFEQIAAYANQSFQITGVGDPEQIDGAIVSDNFLVTIGLQPALGRGFMNGETHAVLLGNAFWRRKFNADPTILGHSIAMNGESFLVVGILAAPQILPKEVDVITPFGTMIADFDRTNRQHHVVTVVGRMKPGVPIEQASAEIGGITARLQRDYPATNKTIGSIVIPLAKEIEGDTRTALLVLMAVVGLVLLIATANVANLLLARAAGRRTEIAIRIALGAGRGQLVRQLLTESLTLAGAGGIVGVLLAVIATPWLRVLATGKIARAASISVDFRTLLFALGIAIASGILFGLAPALASTRADQNQNLRSGRGSAGTLHRGLRATLVSGQVALAMLVLVGTALLTRSLMRLSGVDPGFNVDHVLTALAALPSSYKTPAQINGFYHELIARMATKPGVMNIVTSDSAPLSNFYNRTRFAVDGAPPPEAGRFPVANNRLASPGYFQAMHIQMFGGREFDERDMASADCPVIVNETLARRFFAGNALGRNLLLGVMNPKPVKCPIVGVVADTLDLGLNDPVEPVIYFAGYGFSGSAVLLAHTTGDPMALVPVLRREVSSLDRETAIRDVRTMDEIVDKSLAGRKFSVLLISMFATLALALAAVGLYGVISYSVTQRSREIGLRMALGAQQKRVLGMIVAEALKLTIAGAAAGAIAALFGSHAIASQLFGVRPTDPESFEIAAVTLIVVALAGSWIPAIRAMRVDPAIALRDE